MTLNEIIQEAKEMGVDFDKDVEIYNDYGSRVHILSAYDSDSVSSKALILDVGYE